MTNLPPPDEPDIYESLAAALIEASTGIRTANETGFAALEPMDRAIELTAGTPDLLRQARELSEQAWDLRHQAGLLTTQGGDEDIAQADGLRRQSGVLIGQASVISEQVLASVLESRSFMRQSIEQLMAASEIHRLALERATMLLYSARRRQSNGDNPDALTA